MDVPAWGFVDTSTTPCGAGEGSENSHGRSKKFTATSILSTVPVSV